jgi:hypothetical protein
MECVINNEEIRAMKAATLTKGEVNARMSGGDGVTPAADDRRALIDGLNRDLAG